MINALFDTAAVAKDLGCHVSTVRRLARDRGIGYLVGTRLVFTPADISRLRAALKYHA